MTDAGPFDGEPLVLGSEQLLDLVHAALTAEGATDAGDRVQRPGDLPTQLSQYPVLKLRLIGEDRQSLGRGGIHFLTTATIRVVGEVSEPAALDDPNISAAEASLWALKRQVERAIVNSYPLFRVVQQLAFVKTQLAFAAGAQHLAGIQSDYGFEFHEGAESFAPVLTNALTEVDAVDPLHPSLRIRAPLVPF